MVTLFWVNICIIAFVYFGYPLIVFALASLQKAKTQKGEISPFVTIIFPLHNEERVIKDRIENALALDYPQDKLEIIFALDNCTDRTKDIIKEANEPRITVYEYSSRAGKVETLNKTVPQAQGEIVIFSDANSIHKSDTIRKIVNNFLDPRVGCVCGKLIYTDADSTMVGKGENLYWKYEHFIKEQESRLGKLLITNGSIQAVRKELYPFPAPEIADDLSIPIMIRAKGYKIVYEPKARVYEVATQSIKEEFAQKVRIISQGFKGVIKLRKYIFQLGLFGIFQFVVHKLLRWLIALCLIVVFISNMFMLQRELYLLIFLAQTVFYLFALTGFYLRSKKQRIKIFYIPFYFCLVNFASLLALHRVFSNGETRLWDKAHSTRVRR